MNRRKLLVATIVAILGSVFVTAVMAAFADLQALETAFASFPVGVFAAMLALGLLSYFVRAVRWRALLSSVGTPVSTRDAIYMQLSAQTMTVTPGRAGEIMKPWLANRLAGLPMSSGIALVFCERVADLIAVCILSLGGLSVLGARGWTLPTALGAIAFGTAVASSRWFHRVVLSVVQRRDWMKRHHASIAAISGTVRSALSWRVLWWSILASVVAWGLEGLGMWLCIRAFDAGTIGPAAGISVYAISTIIGAFTFLPGGIGVTEASMAGILVANGVLGAEAAVITTITRVATLWWGVGIGWIVFGTRPQIFTELAAEEI